MSKMLVGRYELIEKIGEGGMAVVYKSRDRLLNRYVAIKILRPEYTRDKQFVENFRKESQAAAGLQHPNIVSVYDVGKEGSIYFIVMELIDGRPLSDVIKEQAPMDYKRAIEITKQVASALSLAHKNNIIHRDVKPHNIMITADGTAKLTDFGIAKAISDSTLVSETSRIIGSVHYFSPEQARGAYVDERSDIYSLGIVLYEMLTGQVPFDGDNPVQVALMHINNEITPPSQLVAGIPPALEKLVMKATDKFQSNRYRNADEMLEDLDNIEFVTKMVGNSVFAADDVKEFQQMNENKVKSKQAEKPVKQKEKSPDTDSKNKKKKKTIMIIVAVIAAAAVLFGALYAMGVIGGKKTVTVPDLKNMTYAQAEEKLQSEGLVIKRGDDVASADVDKGKVTSQTPAANEEVKEGSTVTVNISSGKESDVVPSVIGQEYDETTISDYFDQFGFALGNVSYEYSDEDKGIIIDQSPSAGESADEGASVDIVVSKGQKTTTEVPTVTGQTYDDAVKLLTDAGFTVGKTTYEESTTYNEGIVMWQQYEPGTEVKKGASIAIKVSKGAPTVEPDPEDPGNSTGDGGTGDSGTDNGSGNDSGSDTTTNQQ